MTRIPAIALRRFSRNAGHALRGLPTLVLVNILLTRRCSQNCLQCTIPQTPGPVPFMPTERFRDLIDRLDRYGTQIISLSGGEPLLHPDLFDCMRYTASKKFSHVQILTNLYNTPTRIEELIEVMLANGIGIQSSFDGFGEVADRLRGAENVSEQVMRNMELLTAQNRTLRRPVRLAANLVISRLNLAQVPEIVRYLTDLGWRINADIYRWRSGNQRELEELKIDDGPELRRVLDVLRDSPAVITSNRIIDGFPAYLKDESPKYCPYLDSPAFGTRIYVNPDGSVDACLGRPIGNLFEQSPGEFFRSVEWLDRIEEMRACTGCWNTCYTSSAITLRPRNRADLKHIWEMYRNG